MACYSETFYQLLVDESADNKPLSLSAENLAQLHENVMIKYKSKNVSEEVNTTIVKLKSILDGYLQQHNVLNPKDRNTIECKLSATNFARKAFLVDGIDGTNYPAIYSFAFYEKMRKTTTISKLEKKGSGYQSQCFCQKSYLCDGEERTGDFKILLAFTNYSDTKVDLYMSMKGFPVLSNVKGGSSSKESSSSSSKEKKRKRKDEEQEAEASKKASSSGSTTALISSPNISITSTEQLDFPEASALPFAHTSIEADTAAPLSMMGLLNSNQTTTQSTGDFIQSEMDNSLTIHQLWDPSFYHSLPIFQHYYSIIENQLKLINKLKEEGHKIQHENSNLKKKNVELIAENEKLKEIGRAGYHQVKSKRIPEDEEELIIDDDYQSKEKKPLDIFGESEEYSVFNENKPEEENDMDFFFSGNDEDDYGFSK